MEAQSQNQDMDTDQYLHDFIEEVQDLLIYSKPFTNAYVSFTKNTLNGRASAMLLNNAPKHFVKESGTYFTPEHLSKRLLFSAHLRRAIKSFANFLDPACGTGDLLIAVAKFLPLNGSFQTTVTNWSSVMIGYDIHKQFILAARLKLLLLAKLRCKYDQAIELSPDIFPLLTCNDFLANIDSIPSDTLIVMNPPFARTSMYGDFYPLGSGQQSLAAIFLYRVLQLMGNDSVLAALLPDVLRSGTNYKALRRYIAENYKVLNVENLGQFSHAADIDVFTMHCAKGRSVSGSILVENTSFSTLDEIVYVNVGPVVPHRNCDYGDFVPYIQSKDLGDCHTLRATSKITFAGKLFKPPFLLLRRTSRPGDPNRLKSTIVLGENPVALENHLIVLTPKNQTIAECFRIQHLLKSSELTRWLNNSIRCRHLTTQAVGRIPLNLESIYV